MIGNNPNIFFNFNINKLNCPFPMEMMNQINKKLKDYQSVSKKGKGKDINTIYNNKLITKINQNTNKNKVYIYIYFFTINILYIWIGHGGGILLGFPLGLGDS